MQEIRKIIGKSAEEAEAEFASYQDRLYSGTIVDKNNREILREGLRPHSAYLQRGYTQI